jgi:hypothetical protein
MLVLESNAVRGEMENIPILRDLVAQIFAEEDIKWMDGIESQRLECHTASFFRVSLKRSFWATFLIFWKQFFIDFGAFVFPGERS